MKNQIYIRGKWLELGYGYWLFSEGKRDLDVMVLQKLYGCPTEKKNPKILFQQKKIIYLFIFP